ncbi:integrase arm-type DNA-binding domain-containing protein [Rugamonas sp.]|uniref:tyrosine-type recombinase/integrase n=1 Tax=Rugamonas sp. TaxID=1926287 RepID=UPI0026004AFF|nr:integrase arm-type DNA-binding domain-containing protein [Rugamonas sp.]
MSKRIAPLTDLQVRTARPGQRMYRLYDGGGLYLEVSASGSKLWKFKYRRLTGSESRSSFGAYPAVSLVEARGKRAQARRQLADGIDPFEAGEAALRAARDSANDTFEAVAREWHATMIDSWQPGTAENILHRLEVDIFPFIGTVRIVTVTSRDILFAIRKVEQRGALEIAKRLTEDVARVFDFAVNSGKLDRNPATTLKNALRPREKGHFAAIDSTELPALLKSLAHNEACMGHVVRLAMRLVLLIFVRTSELIETPWSEIDLERGEWTIPWRRMKRGKRKVLPCKVDHYVCLSRQALALLRELHTYTGGGKLPFPNMRDGERPMSNMAILKALERMGYKGDMTGHGFRALAMSTLKEQLHYRHEVVDRQLAHAQKDELETAYDRASYLEERGGMMQAWADNIDSIMRGLV